MKPICIPQQSAEDELLSLTYQTICEAASSIDTFTHYLLAIAGLSVSAIIFQLETLLKFFTLKSIFLCLCILFLSAFFGVLAKYFACFRNGSFITMETIMSGVDSILNRHSEELNEQHFKERFSRSIPVFVRLAVRFKNQNQLPFYHAFKMAIYQMIFSSGQLLCLLLSAIPLGVDMYSQIF